MRGNIPLGVYVVADSPLHRMRAGWKFVSTMVVIVLVTLVVRDPVAGLGVLALCVALYPLGKIPARIAWGQVWPALPILVFICAVLIFDKGIAAAITQFFSLLACIVVATVLTLTTRVEEMMDFLDWALQPLARVGVPVHYITLAISLTIRLIPLQLATVREVLDARKARGLERSLFAFGTPVVIRSIRRAEQVADALAARGAVD
ncbi:energy-coupling factor transporter transmembrane component T family protein [Corynebacterium choanae]|uniref:Energy-coupling factor transporter transmembrane protein EcfT n=1 Tax=Corynebacterium choanae TaxID=1862358 RepID=A0A3G6J7D6_9CORY|nr:energy-coupling factor transporter transmembrane protein EcfT [Corynebacterium choanae]AZA13789.1 Energy-coupling factor transporter transmembrane protein EcfT [Corynebacterium choanae]